MKNSFSWKLASKYVEFAFEDGGLRPFGREQEQEQNIENGSHQKHLKVQDGEFEEQQSSYEPSNQIIDFQRSQESNEQLQVEVDGNLLIDEINHTSIFASKSFLPNISITLVSEEKNQQNSAKIEKTRFVQLLIGEKSHSSEYQKYKIIKGGIKGTIKQRVKNQTVVKFQKNRFNYLSNPQKLPRLILVVYEKIQKKRIYKTVMISDQFSIIDNHKLLTIQSKQHLKLYFQPIQTHFLDKTGVQVGKITSLNKHKIIEEICTFQNYLIKKNKKIWNLVYAAYKYSHIVDLYFLNAEGKQKKDQFLQLWRQVIESFKSQEISQTKQKKCNYLDPGAKFILKIHSSMRQVRFVISKEFTKYLSIIASETQFQNNSQVWTKFDSISEMKEAYIACQTQIQTKIINESILIKASTINNMTIPLNSPVEAPKKQGLHNNSKHDDEDYNQQDAQEEEDDGDYDGSSSENYSVSNKKRGRKLGQRKNNEIKKIGSTNIKDLNKYSTRIRRNKEDTEDSNDKKAMIIRKNKQKEQFTKIPVSNQGIGAPPFRVLTPGQAGQYKDQQTQSMIGIVPMGTNLMMGAKKNEETKVPQPTGIPKGGVVYMQTPQQIMSMMNMLQQMPSNGMNGMQLMMPMTMDKNQPSVQLGASNLGGMPAMAAMGNIGGMPSMNPMGIPMGIPMGMPGMGMNSLGMNGMPGMGPFMMGNGNQGMQGMVMPMMQPQTNQKNKQTDSQKQKNQNEKKEQKKQSGVPNPSIVGMMPNGQMMMGMPQFMQMGMSGMPGMQGIAMPGIQGLQGMQGMQGMPQGMGMNPLVSGHKMDGKQDPTKQMQAIFSNGMQFVMPGQMPGQMAAQMNTSDSGSQNSNGMSMNMMGQFPIMGQIPQGGMQGFGQNGMGMNCMVMTPEQMSKGLNPQQMQFQMMQMPMMMGKNMMPKNDQNQQGKKCQLNIEQKKDLIQVRLAQLSIKPPTIKMSLLKKIHSQLTGILAKTNQPIEGVNNLFKNFTLVEQIQISGVFPSIDKIQDKQLKFVYASLTVQDILEPQYFYAYLIKKPVSPNSDVKILKFGFEEKELEQINLDQYEPIMECRETVVCVDDFYRTDWLQNQWKGPIHIKNQVCLKMPQNHSLKLGERVNAVCVWNPTNQFLVFIRNATIEQVEKQKLCFSSKFLSQQIKMKEMKDLVCNFLDKFCTKPQSLLTLYSMISDEPMFTNGENITQQISQILPRVCHLKIKAPFKQSFFPYKNHEGFLVQTNLQLSSLKTFVIIDFSEFSEQKEVKIDEKEIDNLKALKLFVEQGKTIYRWEYGESLMDHVHSGIIVKGSKIISPHFHLSENLIDSERKNKNPFKQLDIGVKMKIRGYLDKCIEIKPTLNNEQRMKIQEEIKREIQKYPNERVTIQQRMQLARLNAKSLGKASIEYEDYILAKDLLLDSH